MVNNENDSAAVLRHLLRLLALPAFALLQLRQPGAVLLQEIIHVAFFGYLFVQAAQPTSEQTAAQSATAAARYLSLTSLMCWRCSLLLMIMSKQCEQTVDVLGVGAVLPETRRLHVVQL